MDGAYTLFDKPKRVVQFKAFLTERGCDVLAPTNEWEMLRFVAAGRTNIAYKNARGRLSIVGPDMGIAASSFMNGQSWVPAGFVKSVRPKSFRKRNAITKRIIERDGDVCFYCGEALGEDWTLEHLIPLIHGGTNRVGNMALAHAGCNSHAGHLSVIEKIKLRETMRRAVSDAALPDAEGGGTHAT